ncbi:alpha/beta hydrolase family protein [Jiulongibacter sp. NS-SX5]|uniref:alpha/beta hydrolase family protein n=1 Tax=Jiulongibacter sp. NS-SX5 TaxID=3463854 RepID=UPI00405904BC
MKKLNQLLIFLCIPLLFSCSEDNPQPSNEFLQEYTLVNDYSREEFKALLSSNFGDNADQLELFIQSGIQQYKLSYLTKDLFGNETLASGALMLPTDVETEMAIASVHHGTLFNETDAPSYFNPQSESLIGSFLAASGIIVAMPDYIGYGDSKDKDHPYEHREGLAVANIDFLRAVREFLSNNEIGWNEKLLLAGYSEGGYATMATHKYLQDNLKSEFTVTASVCGSGAYDKTATFNELINKESAGIVGNNRSYLWVLDTYDKAYNLGLNYSEVFKEPWATDITANGFSATIEQSLNTTLQPDFIEDFNAGNISGLSSALADNDIYDWKPEGIVRLYHGNDDQYVPYLNSVSAINAMKANGTQNVELITVDGGTHGSTIGSFIFGVLELFTINKN